MMIVVDEINQNNESKKINFLASDVINSSHALEFNITDVIYVPVFGNVIWIN